MSNIFKDKVVVITGATQGLGLELAKRFLKEGANLSICARNLDRLAEVKKALEKRQNIGQQIFSSAVDVSKANEVETCVSETYSLLGRIDILINNAGIYGPKGSIDEIEWDEWIQAIEINLYGSVLMSKAVIPYFQKIGGGKIIQLSGGGATNPLPNISAYAVSKAAIVRFVETLAEEVRHLNIFINAIAPGALNTGMLDEIIEAGPKKVGEDFFEKALKQKSDGGTSLNKAVNLAIFLGSSKSNGISGKLISAVWDDWSIWPDHIDELSNSDLYTLRRITGKDRNSTWGDK